MTDEVKDKLRRAIEKAKQEPGGLGHFKLMLLLVLVEANERLNGVRPPLQQGMRRDGAAEDPDAWATDAQLEATVDRMLEAP